MAPSDRKRSRADRCYFFNIFCGRRRDGRRCDEQTGGRGGIVARSTASCVAPRWGRERGRRSGVRVAMAQRSAADAPPERARAARTAPAEPRSRGWMRTRLCASVCGIVLAPPVSPDDAVFRWTDVLRTAQSLRSAAEHELCERMERIFHRDTRI